MLPVLQRLGDAYGCLSVRHASVNAALSVRQVAPVVLREFYYSFPLKIVVHNFTQSHTTVKLNNGAIIIVI